MSDSLFPAETPPPSPSAPYRVLARKYRPQRLRGSDRPGADGQDARQLLRREPHPSGLHLHRRPRHRQDHDRAHPRPRLQLRLARQGRPAERRHAGTRPPLPGDHGFAPCRRDRDGRGLAHRHRRRARDHRERALPAGLRPHQGLHHRRGPHAVEAGLQRPAEDARGAARARQVPVRHHRDRQGADHGAVALHSLRPQADRVRPDGRAPRQNRRRRRRRGRAERADADRPGRGGFGARRAVAARPGHRLWRAYRGHGARGARHARPLRPGRDRRPVRTHDEGRDRRGARPDARALSAPAPTLPTS